MKIKASDQSHKSTSDWLEQIERSCVDLQIVDTIQKFHHGGMFAMLDFILRAQQPPDYFHMGTARQMAVDASRIWQARTVMPGTSND